VMFDGAKPRDLWFCRSTGGPYLAFCGIPRFFPLEHFHFYSEQDRAAKCGFS
jgi:hypothetical protein